MALYRISDRLLAHKPALEAFLYERERDLFDLDEVITLYDLTNTYFEGTAQANANAAFGKFKEKRSDCPLVTLALVLDASGFPKRSRVFAGNAAEAQTLAEMMRALTPRTHETPPTVVLDAGIATEENIAWLNEQGYRHKVVSRRHHRQFDADDACLIKEDGPLTIRAQRVVNDDTVRGSSCTRVKSRSNSDGGARPEDRWATVEASGRRLWKSCAVMTATTP